MQLKLSDERSGVKGGVGTSLTTLPSSPLHAGGASSALSPPSSPPGVSSASCRPALCKTPSVSAPSDAGGHTHKKKHTHTDYDY